MVSGAGAVVCFCAFGLLLRSVVSLMRLAVSFAAGHDVGQRGKRVVASGERVILHEQVLPVEVMPPSLRVSLKGRLRVEPGRRLLGGLATCSRIVFVDIVIVGAEEGGGGRVGRGAAEWGGRRRGKGRVHCAISGERGMRE